MRYLWCLSIAAALVIGSTSGARADFMDWSYHWSITPGQVLSSGTGSVALALVQDGTDASTIPAATVTTTSSATDAAPDKYNVGYNLTLHLTDNPSKKSGDLTFHGTVAGTVSADSANLTKHLQRPDHGESQAGWPSVRGDNQSDFADAGCPRLDYPAADQRPGERNQRARSSDGSAANTRPDGSVPAARQQVTRSSPVGAGAVKSGAGDVGLQLARTGGLATPVRRCDPGG